MSNLSARIRLKPNASPFFCEPRQLPIHIKPIIITKLRQILSHGILEKVPQGGSEWASPIVVVPKPNGDVRICADYKAGVNEQICSDSYPLPNVEVSLASLVGCRFFAKLDLTSAYNQIKLDESSKEILTINTPLGLLRWTRMPYGVKTAGAIFQAAMEAIIGEKTKNVIIYQYDVCIGAAIESELNKKVGEMIQALQMAGMTLNERKCVLRTNEISFLGYRISEDGVRPDRRLIDRVLAIQPPTNKKELESFIGLVNYYGRYLDKFAERIESLTQPRRRNVPFKWEKPQEDAFQDIKRALAAYPMIQIFDPKKITTVTTDASETAVSAIISQNNHPVLYLSRRLSSAEQQYSNIEREELAVVYACRRARHLLLGKKFLLQCDHRPLEFIFHPSRNLPKVTSARILRWALQLAAFDYDIQYVKGKSIPHVDALSRLPMKNEVDTAEMDHTFIHWTETDVLTKEEIQEASANHSVLSSIMKRVRTNRWSGCSQAEKPFKAMKDLLSKIISSAMVIS